MYTVLVNVHVTETKMLKSKSVINEHTTVLNYDILSLETEFNSIILISMPF